MIPYLIVFSSCIFLFSISDVLSKNENSRYVPIVISLFAIIIISALAGARDSTVGTDTANYGDYLFLLAKHSSSIEKYNYLISRSVYDVNIGYSLFTYFVTKLFNSRFMYYFSIQLLTIVPIYISIYRLTGGKRILLPMMIYCIYLFPISLNLMRQLIAVSITTLAVSFYIENKKIIYIILTLLSVQFHTSAAVCFLLIPFSFISKLIRNNNNINYGIQNIQVRKILIPLISIVLFILIILNFSTIIQNASIIFPSLSRYASYTRNINGSIGLYSNAFNLILCIITLYYCRNNQQESLNTVMIYIVFSMVFSITSYFNPAVGRISYYCQAAVIPLVCYLSNSINKRYRRKLDASLLTILLVNFIYSYCINNYNEIIPYTSNLL